MISPRRVQQLTKQGVIPKTEHGRYELAPAVQGYITFLQERNPIRAGGDDGDDYHKEKARLTRLQADRAESELAERMGQLLDADDVAQTWADMIGRVRNKLLAMPSKIAPLVSHVTEPAEIQQITDDLIRDALEEMADEARDAIAHARTDTTAAETDS